MKKNIVMFLLICFALEVQAQSVSFSNLRLEHNVKDKNGRSMLQFHFSISVSGCLGHDVKAYMFVDIPQGTGHKYPNGSNMVATSQALRCSWNTTQTSGDWWVGIYNDQLNPLPGKNTYYTRLWVKDENTGKWIGHSDFLSFDNTGSNNSVVHNQNNNVINAAPLSPRIIYLKDSQGIVSKTTVREYTDVITGELERQVMFWCHDGIIHYFFYSHFNNGWHVYQGYELFPKRKNNEIIFINNNCTSVVFRSGNNERRFDIASNEVQYREYSMKMQSLIHGTYVGGGNSSISTDVHSNSTQNNYRRCSICGGSGRCTSCNGRGTSTITGHTETCNACRGDGRCRNCWGKGTY